MAIDLARGASLLYQKSSQKAVPILTTKFFFIFHKNFLSTQFRLNRFRTQRERGPSQSVDCYWWPAALPLLWLVCASSFSHKHCAAPPKSTCNEERWRESSFHAYNNDDFLAKTFSGIIVTESACRTIVQLPTTWGSGCSLNLAPTRLASAERALLA